LPPLKFSEPSRQGGVEEELLARSVVLDRVDADLLERDPLVDFGVTSKV
jgi:hypothetical protein